MSGSSTAPARVPPGGLPGLSPEWSKLVAFSDAEGTERTLHVLDHCEGEAELTLLCCHGNPSWSYLWRNVIAQVPAGVRVIAPDHLNMGFSERTGRPRILAERIDDVRRLTAVLDIDTPVITLAHDWGGPISLGWALDYHRAGGQLAGVILTNTAVHQPPDAVAPRLITTIRTPGLLAAMTEKTTGFIRGGLRLSHPEPTREIRDAFMAPYLSTDRRAGIRQFVEDIPLKADHVSYSSLEAVAQGLEDLAEVPALLLWGTRDPVFGEAYLEDLEQRLPHADVHRFTAASHFVSEDAPVAEAVSRWILDRLDVDGQAQSGRTRKMNRPLLPALSGDNPLVTEWSRDGWRSVGATSFADRVRRTARGLQEVGVEPGDRVAAMIPPGIDLTVIVYSCWQIGATAVLVDSGLGIRNMGRAVKSANPNWLVGIKPAVAAAKALRWGGRRIVVGPMDSRLRATLGVELSLREVELAGETGEPPTPAEGDPLAALVFTSGSTGPSKGVRYRASQIAAQRDLITGLYGITPQDRLVAAFAPFALYGPALGIPSLVPNMDVTAPGSLTAVALAEAVVAIEATMIFASPSAFANVVATASSLAPADRAAMARVRIVMSAGAPIALELLEDVAELFPEAELHSPYGMTEVLPVANISFKERTDHGAGSGACVGRPISGVEVRIRPLEAGGTHGEVEAQADHIKDGYHRLWLTEARSRTADGWHRTGDTGYLDKDGYLWITGRIQHVIHSSAGPLFPVPYEHAAQQVLGVDRAAAVGVGPVGTQVPILVVESQQRSGPRATPQLSAAVRSVVVNAMLPEPAAVLCVASIPVDKRHNSKVDRGRVQVWAERVLAGQSRVRM